MKTVENYCSALYPSLTLTFTLIVLLLVSQSWETLQQPHVSEDFKSDILSITNPPHYVSVLITDMPLCPASLLLPLYVY